MCFSQVLMMLLVSLLLGLAAQHFKGYTELLSIGGGTTSEVTRFIHAREHPQTPVPSLHHSAHD